MSIDFVFSFFQASVVAIALPIVAICLFYLISPRLGNRSGGKLQRYLAYLIAPPRLGLNNTSDDTENKKADKWRTDKVRLFFYYLGIVLFLTSFMIGEFYQVMLDLLIPVTQGSTGEMRIVTSVLITSPFSIGWVGSLPWIGQVVYHETWDWIFFTAAFTDNTDFLSSLIGTLTMSSIAVGLVFLAPLAIKRIRHSFLASIFFFMTAMTVFTKAATECLAYALALVFVNVELDYLTLTATGSMIPGLATVIAVMLPIVLAMFAFFMIIGRRLWKVHYADSRSRTWFMVYITLSFWLGLAITILMV